MSWKTASDMTSTLVNVTVILAALVAAFKFHFFMARPRAELRSSTHVLRDNRIALSCELEIQNPGIVPVRLSKVTMTLSGCSQGTRLEPKADKVLDKRCFPDPKKDYHKILMTVLSGERSIFPLTQVLPAGTQCVCVTCSYSFKRFVIAGQRTMPFNRCWVIDQQPPDA